MHNKQTSNTYGRRFILVVLSAAMLLTSGLALAAGPEPQTITEGMSCAACGMYPQRYPQWQTQIIFTDGAMAAFDGNKCMFRFLLNMQKFTPERKVEQVAAIWVKDFKTGKWLDGKTAHYVIDSKEMGPMGKELIPFATRAAAEEFQKANGGTIETFANISMDTIRPLMGGMHMQMNMPRSPIQ
ncbi:MAG: nitrous oxide reductase accessory protein NosL [Deltaproteobacteria bacterium]|nr:nitrous oxide reductase accessory protein NosL [Deltaproteobacteria bacterium]